MTVDPKYAETDIYGNELSDEEKQWCDDNDHRPEPFAKLNWKSAESRDTWRDLHEQIKRAHYESEWRSVLSDNTDRQAAIIHINNYNREDWLQRIGEHDLVYRDIRYSKPYEGFSHKFIPTDESDLERITYSVIAQDDDVVDKFVEAELEMESPDRHDIVGEFLNFPKCCREFFANVWIGEEQIDPMYEITCNTDCSTPIDGDKENVLVEDPEPWNNVLYRYWGLSFLTHIPCSWDCEGSKEVAKNRGEVMANNGMKEEANALYNWMNLPMVWTGKSGLAHVKNEHMLGSSSTSTYWSPKRIVWKEENEAGGEIV